MFNIIRPLLVWTYHRVLPGSGNAAVALDVFEKQIIYLLKKGYKVLDVNGLESWFNGELNYADRYTVLTFDDGWGDNYFYVTPILKKYGIKAVMAVNTGFIDTESDIVRSITEYPLVDSKKALSLSVYNNDKTSFLTKAELIKLKESGIWDIQPHGNSHFGCYHSLDKIRGLYPDMWHWTMKYAIGCDLFDGAPRAEFRSTLASPRTKLKKGLIEKLKEKVSNNSKVELCNSFSNSIEVMESEIEFSERLKSDIKICETWLVDEIDINPKFFFWPWGHYSKFSTNIAKELGYKFQFTMDKDSVSINSLPEKIPRIAVPADFKRFVHQEKVFTSISKRKIREAFNLLKKKK